MVQLAKRSAIYLVIFFIFHSLSTATLLGLSQAGVRLEEVKWLSQLPGIMFLVATCGLVLHLPLTVVTLMYQKTRRLGLVSLVSLIALWFAFRHIEL